MYITTRTVSSVFSLPISHEDEGGDAVEGDHAEVRYGQVHKEVVRHAPHPPVAWPGILQCN